MARKSRKHQAGIVDPVSSNPNRLRAAAYLRISEAKNNLLPESIENQLKIIQEFLRYQPDIALVATYSDINASGRTFQRSGFQEMLTAIEAEKIDCVIVKDLSRLGRNMIEAGYYIEIYFPIHHVRLISVTDHVDNVDGVTNLDKRNHNGIPLINFVNETVSNEIGQSTQAVLDNYAIDGKYIAPRAPYGYRKSPDDCHKLLIDPEAADIVKKIFTLARNGTNLTEIVRLLNQSNVFPPSLYARQHGLVGNYLDADGCWNTRTLKKLLTNYTYTGNLRQGKHQISVSNTHEPIVSSEVFEMVQKRFSGKTANAVAVEKNSINNPLRGKVICGHCGSKMQRKRGSGQADWCFFTCIMKNRRGSDYCHGEYIRESDIIAAICQELSTQQSQFIAAELECKQKIARIKEEICKLQEAQKTQLRERQNAYERYVMGQYTSQEYKSVVSGLPSLEPQIDALTKELEQSEDIKRMLQTKMLAINDQDAFESFLKDQLQQVTVSSGMAKKVLF